MAKLRHQWKMFADEYIISGNIYQSAVNAGYSENYARTQAGRLLENVSVKTYLDEQLGKLQKKKIASAEDVLMKFTAILNQELTEEKIEVNPLTGEFITIERKPTINEVIKAGIELMKRYPTAANQRKLLLEIEKLRKDIEGNQGQDDKLTSLIASVQKAVLDDTD
ncbi:terminase small subunit [Globicatella sanguinis]